MRGRKPKPTALLKLKGSYKPDRHAERQDLGTLEIPELDAENLPIWMTEVDREVYRDAINSAPRNVLKDCDRGLLASWAMMQVMIAKSWEAQTKENGKHKDTPFLAKGVAGYTVSPLVRVIFNAVDRQVRIASELGFTPSSRTKLRLIGAAANNMADTDTPQPEWMKITTLQALKA